MSKIFSFNEGLNGSLIDPVSGAKGVNTNGVFKRADKGIAWIGNGVDSQIDFDTRNIGKTHTIVINFNLSSIGLRMLLNGDGNDNYITVVSATEIFYRAGNATPAEFTVSELIVGKDYQLILTRDGTVASSLYINNIKQCRR